MTIRIGLFLLFSIFTGGLSAQDIIPAPRMVDAVNAEFEINANTSITYDKGLRAEAELLADFLSPATGFDFELIGNEEKSNTINLKLDNSLPEEGYELYISNKSITISGQKASGVFYGTQTLLQLLPVQIYSQVRHKEVSWRVPGVHIQDHPEYSWRGMMLDVSRYFFHKEYVLHLIDIMAMYKMNVLHLHLIDDAGWRLEIKKYPKLTSIGGFRGTGQERTGGYYTQEDIREMVAYASLRSIEVIPEIEIPAHTLPAIVAYPWLSCTGEQYEVQTQHSISGELYCAGKESTFDFLEDVLKETFDLFPSKYVHIGGDEAKYDRWNACSHCQSQKEMNGLKTGEELQVYFTNRIQKMAAKFGKTIVGWDEIIERGLEDKAVGMVWHNLSKATSAVANGHDVVMALTSHCYFDVAESNTPGEIKAATWLPPITLEKVYALNPLLEELEDRYRPRILGAHATLWSDQFIHGTTLQELEVINENRSEKYFDYLTLPRLAALAEVCWTPKKNKDWNDFQRRMATHYLRYDYANYGYRVPEPQLISVKEGSNGFQVKLGIPVAHAEIHYTTDGTKPNPYSTNYRGPVTVYDRYAFKAITVVNRQQFSLPFFFDQEDKNSKKYGQLIGEWSPSNIGNEGFTMLEYDATGKVNQNGTYEITFDYNSGQDNLEIVSIELLKNQQSIAEDTNPGIAGGKSQSHTCSISLDGYETGAAFKIKVKIIGDQLNDSFGRVYIKQKETIQE